MTPIQQIRVRTNVDVLYEITLTSDRAKTTFAVDVVVRDGVFQPPFSATVAFPARTFGSAADAYQLALGWVRDHAHKFGYPIFSIHNPVGDELIKMTDQAAIVQRLGLSVGVGT